MNLLRDLLFTDYGLMSLIVILGVLVIAFWFKSFFSRKMAEDAASDRG